MNKTEYQNYDRIIKIQLLFENKIICIEIIPDCLGRLLFMDVHVPSPESSFRITSKLNLFAAG